MAVAFVRAAGHQMAQHFSGEPLNAQAQSVVMMCFKCYRRKAGQVWG